MNHSTAKMGRVSLFFVAQLLLSFDLVLCSSSLLIEDGVYSRITVQIEPQTQPENCVEFLDHLEVRSMIDYSKLQRVKHTHIYLLVWLYLFELVYLPPFRNDIS